MNELDDALATIKKARPKARIHREEDGTVYIVIPAEQPAPTGKWGAVAERLHQENRLGGGRYREAQDLFREFRGQFSD